LIAKTTKFKSSLVAKVDFFEPVESTTYATKSKALTSKVKIL